MITPPRCIDGRLTRLEDEIYTSVGSGTILEWDLTDDGLWIGQELQINYWRIVNEYSHVYIGR